jgi:menaquinone-dependent protoporphyrinogen oxidase
MLMRVLVAYASYYGATREIAAKIFETLTDNGVEASLRSVDDSLDLEGFDAFVLGSAIHAGRWLKPAAQFVTRNEAVLRKHPVWLFSSGPVGPGADKPQPDPKEVAHMSDLPSLRGKVVFGGAFDRSSTDFGGWFEKTVGRFIPEGDYRDWAEIETWARGIARELRASEPVLTN